MEFVLSYFLAPFYDWLHALKYFEPMSYRMGIFKKAAEILKAKPHFAFDHDLLQQNFDVEDL